MSAHVAVMEVWIAVAASGRHLLTRTREFECQSCSARPPVLTGFDPASGSATRLPGPHRRGQPAIDEPFSDAVDGMTVSRGRYGDTTREGVAEPRRAAQSEGSMERRNAAVRR